jgi:uncharacterized protein (TIGR02186 family)
MRAARWSAGAGLIAGLCTLAARGAGASSSGPPAARVPVSVSVSEREIDITPRYRGELVRVGGAAPAGCDVVVKLTSSTAEARYSRKGKVGPVWISVGQVRFENVPLMYKLKSSAVLDDILPLAERLRYGLGREALKASMRLTAGLDRDVYLDELILIRERSRFFGFGEGSVLRRGASFSTTFFWPPNGPPGRYRVEAFAVSGGKIVGSAATAVEVRVVGIEAWVRDLAVDHGVLYGLLAVLVALASGLAVSLAFRGFGRRRAG